MKKHPPGHTEETSHDLQADPTYQMTWADCQTIVTGYRVYVLEDPKIHEVIAADGVTKVNVTFATLIPELQSLINNSSVSATVKTQAQADLNDLTSKVDAAQTSISGGASSPNQLSGRLHRGAALSHRTCVPLCKWPTNR